MRGAASIHIVGNGPHATLWKTLYDRFPDVWKSQTEVIVREVSDAEMDRLVAEEEHEEADNGKNDDSVVDGYYHENRPDGTSTPIITLRKSMPDDEAAFVFTHEYGHFVWYKKMSREERSEYVRLWRQVRRSGSLVTRYAAESEEEGFAEAFAHFLRKPSKLRSMDPRSYRFLSNLQQAAVAKASACTKPSSVMKPSSGAKAMFDKQPHKS